MNVTPATEKPRLLLVPHYTGSLRYYEKLGMYLAPKYEVSFLLIELLQPDGKRYHVSHYNFEEMVSHCTDKALSYYVIRQPTTPFLTTIFPFLQFLKSARSYKSKLAVILSDQRIKKIVAINDVGFYFGSLFNEAKKRSIDALVLQWALTYNGQTAKAEKLPPAWRLFLYRIRRNIITFIRSSLLKGVAGWDVSNRKTVLGSGTAGKFGVINEQAYKYFVSRGVSKEKMTVVGYLDFYEVAHTRDTFDTNEQLCHETAQRLGIDRAKKNIVIFSSAYNSAIVRELDDAGQLAFYEDMVKMIRVSCPEELYTISLKIHPIENLALYAPLKKHGVTLYDKFTNNSELIYFCDLYIADSTTVNFLPILMDKKAIFINFLSLPIIETSREYFGITRYITDRQEFCTLIEDYTKDRLQKQYILDKTIFTDNSLQRILEWVG